MLIRFCCVSNRAFGRSITSRSGSLIAWIEGTSGLVERISTAGPSFSCTIRKLLIAATLLKTEEVTDFEGEGVVWERSLGVPNAGIPTTRATNNSARKLRRYDGCRNLRFGGKSFTEALEYYSNHTTRGVHGKRPAEKDHEKIGACRKRTQGLRIGQKFVLINDRCHRHLAGWIAAFDPYHPALAAHPDALRQRDFGRQGQREINRGACLDGGIDIETDSACADVASLRRMLR